MGDKSFFPDNDDLYICHERFSRPEMSYSNIIDVADAELGPVCDHLVAHIDIHAGSCE